MPKHHGYFLYTFTIDLNYAIITLIGKFRFDGVTVNEKVVHAYNDNSCDFIFIRLQ